MAQTTAQQEAAITAQVNTAWGAVQDVTRSFGPLLVLAHTTLQAAITAVSK